MKKWLNHYQAKVDVYRSFVRDESEAKEIVESFSEAAAGKKLYLYGAGTIGRNLVRLFRTLNIPIQGLFDRDAGRIHEVDGIPVQDADAVAQVGKGGDVMLIVAVNRSQYLPIGRFLMEKGVEEGQIINGHDLHMILQSSWCMMLAAQDSGQISFQDCWECTVLDNQCQSLRRYLKRVNGYEHESPAGTEKLYMIGYILGNICTLNCKNCCESVPYYENCQRHFVPREEVLRDIRKLSSACDFLTLLEFVGGEPFLHPELPEILKECLTIPNIGVIHVFTNGTVVPGDSLCEVLAERKICVYLSNYQVSLSQRFQEHCEQTICKLKEYGIQVFRGRKESWSDFRSFLPMEKTHEELVRGFSDCFLHNCNRLYEGRLYVCPHQYAGINLKKLDSLKDTVDIHSRSSKELAEKLEKFRSCHYIDACRFCKMPYHAESVLSGEQLPDNTLRFVDDCP